MAASGCAAIVPRQFCQPGRGGLGVVVEQDDIAPACGRRARIAGSSKADVAPVDDQPHPGMILGHPLRRGVRAGIVHDNDFTIRERLLLQRAEHPCHVAEPVVGRDDDREKRCVHLRQGGIVAPGPRVKVLGRSTKTVQVDGDRAPHDDTVFLAQAVIGLVEQDRVDVFRRRLRRHDRLGTPIGCWPGSAVGTVIVCILCTLLTSSRFGLLGFLFFSHSFSQYWLCAPKARSTTRSTWLRPTPVDSTPPPPPAKDASAGQARPQLG